MSISKKKRKKRNLNILCLPVSSFIQMLIILFAFFKAGSLVSLAGLEFPCNSSTKEAEAGGL